MRDVTVSHADSDMSLSTCSCFHWTSMGLYPVYEGQEHGDDPLGWNPLFGAGGL